MYQKMQKFIHKHCNVHMYLALCITVVFLGISIPTLKINNPSLFLALKEPANISMGMITQPNDQNKLHSAGNLFGKGEPSIVPTSRIQPRKFTLTDGYLYILDRGVNICETQDLCYFIDSHQILFVSTGTDAWWTTNVIQLVPGVPLIQGFNIVSDKSIEARLLSAHTVDVVPLQISEGVTLLKTELLSYYDFSRIPYVFVFSVFILIFCYYMTRWYVNVWKNNRVILTPILFLAITLILRYTAFFPGLFLHDTLISQTNSGYFSIWYSPLYMMYSIGTAALSTNFIQLPLVIIFFWVFSYLISQAYRSKKGKLLTWLLLLIQFLDPSITSIIFSTQRYFLAALMVMSGLVVAFFNHERKLVNYFLSNTLLFISSLLRPEYWVILCIVNMMYFCQNKHLLLCLYKKTITQMFFLFFVITIMINQVIPSIHNPWVSTIKTYYKFATLVGVIEPYIDCQNIQSDNYIQILYKITDKAHEICQLDITKHNGSEQFFWSNIRVDDRQDISIEYNELMQLVKKDILRDPRVEAMHVMNKFMSLLTLNHWNIYSKYEEIITNKALVNPYMLSLDIQYSWQEKLNKNMVSMYAFVSKLLPNFIWFLYILILFPVFFRNRSLILMNSVVITVVLLIACIAPAFYQWAYLILLPIWGTLSIVFSTSSNDELFKLEKPL